MRYEDLRNKYDIAEILRGMGYIVKGGHYTKWCLCPLHTHTNFTPSFSIFWTTSRQRFKCHGVCGKTGDVIDLIGYLNISGYNPNNREHYGNAAQILEFGSYSINPPQIPPEPPPLPQWLWQDTLPPSDKVIEYALSRGLTGDQVVKFNIGSLPSYTKDEPYNIWDPEQWMTIPTFHWDDLIGIKLRNMGEGIRYMSLLGSKKGLFNFNEVNLSTSPVLVLKGEIAVMVADKLGFQACAPTGGEGSYISMKSALAFCRPVVVGDNDHRDHAVKRALALGGSVQFPPREYVGWDDWALAYPEDAIETTKGWLST